MLDIHLSEDFDEVVIVLVTAGLLRLKVFAVLIALLAKVETVAILAHPATLDEGGFAAKA